MSKRMFMLVSTILILTLVSGSAVWAQTVLQATDSCRTDIEHPDTNHHDSSKLSIRNDAKSAKSWIKFDLGDLDVSTIGSATLTVTMYQEKSGDRHFDVAYVNDDYRDNIGWDSSNLTWDNAPGNDPNSFVGLNPNATTYLTTVYYTDGQPGDAFTFDVTDALKSDTDGIVQFIFYNSNGYMNLTTHNYSEESWRPYLTITQAPKYLAKSPYPANSATDVIRTPALNWKPGDYVTGLSPQHTLYLSQDFNDVNDGVNGMTLDSNDYTPNSPLAYGQMYYWRVDEANSVKGWDRGVVWSFTTEPYAYPISGSLITATASSVEDSSIDPNNTCNGVGLDANDVHSHNKADMWVSGPSDPNEAWIAYTFDHPYQLAQMMVWNSNLDTESFIGLGIKDALIEYSVDGNNWTPWGTTQFAQAPDTPFTTVDLNNITAQQVRITAQSNWGNGLFNEYSLSEVRFLYIPTQARELTPASNSINVDPAVTLKWRAGRGAAMHQLYLGPDGSDLPLVDEVTGSPYATYDTSSLDLQLGQTYYWRVDEVNAAQDPCTWQGNVQAFTTVDFIVVDDFESYNDQENQGTRIYETWIDGYGINDNGSQVGYLQAPFAEHTIVHGGSQSMPLYYGNNGASISEATRTFDQPQDWTHAGVHTLSLAFYGDPTNTSGQLYVKINGTKIEYPQADALTTAEWQEWDIDLSTVNTNLQNVTSLTLGVEGGAGLIFIDDIHLNP